MTTHTVDRVLALAGTEVELVLRNRTAAVSAVAVPVVLGCFWALLFETDDPLMAGMVVALQLANLLGLAVYASATQTLVARRHARVLRRMRTSGLTDAQLLVATVAPSVVLGLLQLVVFAVVDVAAGMPLPADPVALLLAILGGLALVVTAALATAVVTSTPERADHDAAAGVPAARRGRPGAGGAGGCCGHVLALVPGVAVAQLTLLAFGGATSGSAAAVPALLALLAWPVVFGALARRHFRWDPR